MIENRITRIWRIWADAINENPRLIRVNPSNPRSNHVFFASQVE